MSRSHRIFRAEVVTLFTDVVEAYAGASILGRAREKGILDLRTVDLRAFGVGRHRVTDDVPYGGGAGMVMKPEPFFDAVEDLRGDGRDRCVILMSPQGRRFTQREAEELSREPRILTFLCGRYEGVDERVREGLAEREFSIGDFVLTGGELAALAIIDASVRLVPGVLGDADSPRDDSFVRGMLEYPQYTRPPLYRGMEVPGVLRSGHHGEVSRWRRRMALERTFLRRPDLIRRLEEDGALTKEELAMLQELRQGLNGTGCCGVAEVGKSRMSEGS